MPPHLSESQLTIIKQVFELLRKKSAAWKDVPPAQSSTFVCKAVYLCCLAVKSPQSFSEGKSVQSMWDQSAQIFDGLARTINHCFGSPVEAERFWTTTLPFMVQCAENCALEMEKILADRLIQSNAPKTIVKTKLQCAQILAGGFFCLFPDFSDPWVSFDFFRVHSFHAIPCVCFLSYFSQVALLPSSEMEGERISFTRKVLADDSETWAKVEGGSAGSTVELCDVVFDDTGTIEDYDDCLQADFANQYIGGGVLQGGNVQEEIRFMINPELCVSMPLSDVMLKNEAIEIVGALQYSKYHGYGGSLAFAGPVDMAAQKERIKLDPLQRRMIRVIAMDAMPMPERRIQYGPRGIEREFNKALAAFSRNPADDAMANTPAAAAGVATGNWGCGMFGGDPQLKSVVQWMACSVAGRPKMAYCAFKDTRVAGFPELVAAVKEKSVTVGGLLKVLTSEAFVAAEPWRTGVFAFIHSQL
mmetsp:Transcript_40586/g.83008  ORF Transcript_40586/g.83008 Transcript_40586/m.83008 type:complete len:473 (+) Transcript_40586:92-1510(+)|eukprot:CAMPEP_0181332020 /NCGR_PEP_ID=MMETSP1101-20121128/24845_1 /TAXON_ID=46948 /ORGANISM="Rhodomonas abbreviata, Strain Caron Lab Isolate" /LENGTH=472 /DNA_ID=CAMNT_0023441585 /DNA_START=60 /DNA_END=1478 /DNA_ORIENTATION=-